MKGINKGTRKHITKHFYDAVVSSGCAGLSALGLDSLKLDASVSCEKDKANIRQ